MNPIQTKAEPTKWWLVAILVVAGLGAMIALLLFLLGLSKVEERINTREVEMFDLTQPPPPPPPPTPTDQQELKPAETTQAVAPDPLSAPQPTSTNPPAGDLNSLLQDPLAGAASGFSGGPRGQGGTGKGPMIGGTGTGGAASRAYAEMVKNTIMRRLRREKALTQQGFSFSVRVRVLADARMEILSVADVNPGGLEADIGRILRSLPPMDQPPPTGGPVPYVTTLRLSQS